MGRNEIRLRRQMMSAGRIAQHRNYSELMARHEREVKLKRVMKIFIYFLIIAFLVIIFIMVARWEKRENFKEQNPKATSIVTYQPLNPLKGDLIAGKTKRRLHSTVQPFNIHSLTHSFSHSLIVFRISLRAVAQCFCISVQISSRGTHS